MIRKLVMETTQQYNRAINSHDVFSAAMVYRLYKSFTTLYVTGVMSKKLHDYYKVKMMSMVSEIEDKYTKEEMKGYL